MTYLHFFLLFIASLAFESAAMLDSAKIAILLSSAIAGTVGWTVLRGAPTEETVEAPVAEPVQA